VTPQEFSLLVLSIIASVSGQFFLKAGALKLGKVNSGNLVRHVLSIVITPELLTGLLCYGLGAITFILLLTRVKLSVAGPAVALTYVFSVYLVTLFFTSKSRNSCSWFGFHCLWGCSGRLATVIG
jgi:hypothetical protein